MIRDYQVSVIDVGSTDYSRHNESYLATQFRKQRLIFRVLTAVAHSRWA